MALFSTSEETLAINTIRTLSMDAVQAANSGHPGTPMALAPVGYLLFNEVMNYDPEDPHWIARDRFILSCGHASMLIYSLLHLSGVKQVDDQGNPTSEPAVSLEEIQNFRQLNSRSPGHPEYRHTTGVETTTGPLGQGIGNSVGMAIAMKWLAANYNRPGYELFDNNIYALCSDGDMMEGVGAEAASLAGHLKLSNLCWFYDDNKITIEGNTDLAFSDDTETRFHGYGWNVETVEDINDLEALRAALKSFEDCKDRPTLIVMKSVIAWGAPNAAGTHGAHGAPLGEDEIRATKKIYDWPESEHFLVPESVKKMFENGIRKRGAEQHASWSKLYEGYKKDHPKLADELDLILQHRLPQGWDADIPTFDPDEKGVASRASSGKVLNAIAKNIPWMIGGSADLAPSNKSNLTFDEAGEFGLRTPEGRNLHFGVREHAMAAAVNGMTLCGLRAYGATFFIFSDYLRPSLRLSALMEIPSLFLFTHDSIGVGEDGPTHQPVEHLAALRAIPNLLIFRPADANEVAECYRAALRQDRSPSALVLTRQNIPTVDRRQYAPADGVAKGAYVLADAEDGKPEVILMASGSEVALCLQARETLAAEGVKARVVSMPCWELFEMQSEEYREEVLPSAVRARVGVELGVVQGWEKYLGGQGRFLGMSGFGASAPVGDLLKHFGITPENLVAMARETLKSTGN
jgi:transketolase